MKSRKRDRDENWRDRYDGDGSRNKLARMEEEMECRRRTVLVSQLTAKVTEDIIKRFFEQLGKVSGVAMPRSDKGKHKGIAYVEMKSSEDVPNCILLNNSVPDFQKFSISVETLPIEGDTPVLQHIQTNIVDNVNQGHQAVPQPLEASLPASGNVATGVQTKVLIRNIHGDVEKQALLDVLQYYGPVSELYLQQSQNTKMAFVTFGDASAAYSARDALHKFELGGYQLEFSLVKSSEDASSRAARVIVSVPLLDSPADPKDEELISDLSAECLKTGIEALVNRKDPRLRTSHEKRGQKVVHALLKCESAESAKKAVSVFDSRFYSGRLMTAYLYGS